MKGRTVLLTGAAGFIGSRTAELLLDAGEVVVGLDNFNDYYDPACKRRNVSELIGRDGFHLVEGDIRDEALLQSIFLKWEFSAVIHLAAMAGVRASVDDPALYLDVNLIGTLRLLEAARKHGRPNFVFASTSSVYGRTEAVPFLEGDSADRPLAPYPASKRAAELLGFAHHHNHGIDFTALRFFTVYGPRNRPDMLPYLVMDSIRKGISFPLYNNGDLQRDWTYVDDIARGLLAAASCRLGYEIVNLGRGEPVLLRDFMNRLELLAGEKATFHDATMPSSDVPITYANIDKARHLLGYDPKVSVAEGVERFFSWYQEI
jgi:UDP-glucuronate 4-epimerase